MVQNATHYSQNKFAKVKLIIGIIGPHLPLPFRLSTAHVVEVVEQARWAENPGGAYRAFGAAHGRRVAGSCGVRAGQAIRRG